MCNVHPYQITKLFFSRPLLAQASACEIEIIKINLIIMNVQYASLSNYTSPFFSRQILKMTMIISIYSSLTNTSNQFIPKAFEIGEINYNLS